MSNLGANFYPKLVQVSSELGMRPEDLLAVMVSESGIDPGAHEKHYGASGLVQMMPDTLKGLHFQGTGEDFRKLSGEAQLDWIKKLIKGYEGLNGGPFTSAAQYYVANFWPVALKLPGVRAGQANTVFMEQNPATVLDPKSGQAFSKKYYDIGFRITPRQERIAYNANPLFHGSVKGAITFGDMINQVEKNKRNPLYGKALMAMKDSTGYVPSNKAPTQMAGNDNHERTLNKYISQVGDTGMTNKRPPLDQTLNNFLAMIAASERASVKLYKSALPTNNILIQLDAETNNEALEFARILSTALNVELAAKAFTYTDGLSTEVECLIAGPAEECFNTVKELAASIAEVFQVATIKIGGVDVRTNCIMNKKSSYQPLSLRQADVNHRTFLLKFI